MFRIQSHRLGVTECSRIGCQCLITGACVSLFSGCNCLSLSLPSFNLSTLPDVLSEITRLILECARLPLHNLQCLLGERHSSWCLPSLSPPQTLPPSSLLISHVPPTLQPQGTSHHSLNMPLFQTLYFPICCFFSWSALPSFLCTANSHSCCKTQLKCHLFSENFPTSAKKNCHSEIH